MTRRFVSGVASRGAFVNIGGRWFRVDDVTAPGSVWGWSTRSDAGWTEPRTTLREAQDAAAQMMGGAV